MNHTQLLREKQHQRPKKLEKIEVLSWISEKQGPAHDEQVSETKTG